MNKTRLGVALAVAVAVALACGEGHLIVNVDIGSFILGSGGDTISFPTIPATLGGSDSVTPPISVQLPPSLSNSVVDTVSMTGLMVFTNTTGSGTIHFEIFFSGDSASAYSGPPALFSDTAAITTGGPDTLHLRGNLTQAIDTLFTQSKVWVGIRASLQAGATSITNGKLVLTDLHAHVVINDKFF
jgi:hypothetical protein